MSSSLRAFVICGLWGALAGCSGGAGPRLIDGGAFELPDAGFKDATVRDTGVDAGPFVCAPGCVAPEVCGCLESAAGRDCGCHPPASNLGACDPQSPETCLAPTVCSRTRQVGVDRFVCTDGRESNPCSKTMDICQTTLGCVCLTPPSGATNCTCTETFTDSSGLCDRMVPETCPNGTCVRVVGVGGTAYFLCSDGVEGAPCERGDGSCNTSLGCTCPVLSGREVCRCSEPGTQSGAPCDVEVPGSCAAPLMCWPQSVPEQGVSTVCASEAPGRPDGGTSLTCDPFDPGTCPPGTICVEVEGVLQCVPG